MELPLKIDPCPIRDAVIEVRFSTNLYPNASFGLIYNALKDQFPNVEKLPILQIPEQVRDSDPGLKYKPHYKLIGENFSVQVGNDVLSVSPILPYPGSKKFLDLVYSVLNSVFELSIISDVTRLGIRYTNYFQNNKIFDNINLDIKISGKAINYKNTVLKTEIIKQEFTSTLSISNNSELRDNNTVVKGSILDIDTYKYYSDKTFIQNFEKELQHARIIEKELFFSLLNENFLKEFNPIYK